MPIPIYCSCQQSFSVRDELVGKKIKCPYCSAHLVVPEPIQEPPFEREIAPPSYQSPPSTQTLQTPTSNSRRDFDQSVTTPERVPINPNDVDWSQEETPWNEPDPVAANPPAQSSSGKRLLGGLAMTIGGVVLVGFIPGFRFYGIMLAIFGIQTFFKALTGSE